MKTRTYLTVLLITLMVGGVSLQAQSARRSAPQERQSRSTVTRNKDQKSTAKRAEPSKNVRKSQSVSKQRNAQSSRQVNRSKAQQPQRQRAVQNTRQVNRSKAQQPHRQRSVESSREVQRSQPQQTQRQRSVESSREVQRSQPQQTQRQRSVESSRQVQRSQPQQSRAVQKDRQTVSVANNHNPRSTYNKPTTKVYSKYNDNYRRDATTYHRRYSNRSYYSGNHYHYVYPTHRVKIHYHYDTYYNNFHVLYYPTYRDIYWTRSMYRDYRRWYPRYTWRYHYGFRIHTISVFDAQYNLGEVAMVYGRVYATWHNRETDDYLLFFGGDYPNQVFTIVLPGRVARRFGWRPERYFLGQHVTVTGLITTFEGIPEIIVKNKRQIGIY